MKLKLVTFILFILLASCQNSNEVSGTDDFMTLWEMANKNYPFFKLKNIDWEEVKENYEPQFRSLTPEKKIELLKEVLNHLEDSHSYLIDTSGNQVSLYFSPRFIKDSALFKEAAIDSYFDKKLLEIENTFRYGITPDMIGYVHIQQFPNDSSIYARFDGILQEFKDCSGLIIDVRHNLGGSSDAVYSIFSQIISDTIQGVNWTDLRGEIVPTVEFFPSQNYCFTEPIIVLINGLSYSASENFANLCKKVEHVTLLGDTTGGGGGVPGTYQLPSGLSFSLSTREMYRYDGNHVEVNGIDPDILIQNSVEELQLNIDNQLEKAIEVLKIRATTSGHY